MINKEKLLKALIAGKDAMCTLRFSYINKNVSTDLIDKDIREIRDVILMIYKSDEII